MTPPWQSKRPVIKFLSRGFSFPGIGDFRKPGNFHPRCLGIFQIWGFISTGFSSSRIGDFYPGHWRFLTILGIKKPTLVILVLACYYNKWNLPSQYFRRTHVHQLFTVDFLHNFVKTQAIRILRLFPEKTFIQRYR